MQTPWNRTVLPGPIPSSRTDEDTSTLKYWLSVGVPSKGGVISDEDFTRWQSWLNDTGAIKGSFDASKFYTNKYNPYASGS